MRKADVGDSWLKGVRADGEGELAHAPPPQRRSLAGWKGRWALLNYQH